MFVGPSGCGKTTTLRMIAGLEEITEGDLEIDGEVVTDISGQDRDISMVFQNYVLYPHMTVFDNMAFSLKLQKLDKDEIERRVTKAVEVIGLSGYLGNTPNTLSGGQRQRVALGRAIVRDPKLFLMDEPLSNPDAKLRVQMREEISRLHDDLAAAIIYVKHDQTEAMTLATRMVVMNEGEIQQVGIPIAIYNEPTNMFVAGFIGSPPMNFFSMTYKNGRLTNNQNLKLFVTEENQTLLEDRGYNDKEIIFGIRPEAISYVDVTDGAADNTLHANVRMTEMTGSESVLYLEIDDTQFEVRTEFNEKIIDKEEVLIAFNMNKAYHFDPETEERVW